MSYREGAQDVKALSCDVALGVRIAWGLVGGPCPGVGEDPLAEKL